MSATAREFKPPWAGTIWYDAEAIYLELPTKSGIPYIVRFPFSEGGLMKALKTLKDLFPSQDSTRGKNGKTAHPMIRRVENRALAKKGLRPQFTEEQHRAARNILRKRGLL